MSGAKSLRDLPKPDAIRRLEGLPVTPGHITVVCWVGLQVKTFNTEGAGEHRVDFDPELVFPPCANYFSSSHLTFYRRLF